jgi:hypothetical protein
LWREPAPQRVPEEAPDQHIETPISAIEYVAGSAAFKGGTMEAHRTNIAAIRDGRGACTRRGDLTTFFDLQLNS